MSIDASVSGLANHGVERLKAAHVALIPTLTLWHAESKDEPPEEFEKGMNKVALPELRAYFAAGGQILFGTDVCYIEQFDTSEEFEWMSRAGMRFQQILASLTTNPASNAFAHRVVQRISTPTPPRDTWLSAYSNCAFSVFGTRIAEIFTFL